MFGILVRLLLTSWKWPFPLQITWRRDNSHNLHRHVGQAHSPSIISRHVAGDGGKPWGKGELHLLFLRLFTWEALMSLRPNCAVHPANYPMPDANNKNIEGNEWNSNDISCASKVETNSLRPDPFAVVFFRALLSKNSKRKSLRYSFFRFKRGYVAGGVIYVARLRFLCYHW